MGNIGSIDNAFELLGNKLTITSDPVTIEQSDAIILPGVGAFYDGMKNLKEMGLLKILEKEVISKKKPYLGICLGLEFLAEKSFEGQESKGFGWIKGVVQKIEPSDKSVKVPHIGWNDTKIIRDDILFRGVENPTFYYLHSYFFKVNEDEKNTITSTCDYGGVKITSSIHKDNIFAVQFHPEKSQEEGLKLLNNFINYLKK